MKIQRSRLLAGTLSAIIILYLVLLIPDKEALFPAVQSHPTDHSPFFWNQDGYWHYLENRFAALRATEHEKLYTLFDSLYNEATTILTNIESADLNPNAGEFRGLETLIFEIAPVVAILPDRYSGFAQLISRIRQALKWQSRHWIMDSPESRTTLYRLIYGGRTALEEVMLQMPPEIQIPDLTYETDEPSLSPSGIILGIPVRSGDILISRGTAPTSALIARGNDFPGNYSHAALVYVDPATCEVKLIESHIECGVTVSSPETYLADLKFRIMVLRLRSDLEITCRTPMIPHNAAEYAVARAKNGRIPYDFSMDLTDTTKWFCSEVVSESYRSQGINLWMGLSHLSSPGLQRWLAGFGVRNFITQEPSDLEYDPQLTIVAEWRDMKKLWKDHYDNAVTEMLLDGANAGEPLQYSAYLLPAGRVLKGWSALLNFLGYVGPVPEGMSATQALRNKWYTRRHEAITEALIAEAARFKSDNGYFPPYWQLVAMAKTIKDRH